MRLAAWRKAEGLTQVGLAELLGCTQPYVSTLERAKDPAIPGPALMIEIFVLTRGAVQPNDFYDLPQLEAATARAA